MDRPKTGTGRGSKSKTPQFPDDLYILGPKGTRAESNETKRPLPVTAKPGPSNPLIDRRRIASSSVSSSIANTAPPAKKPKLPAGVLPRTNPFLPPSVVHDSSKSWENAAIDIESIDLVPTVIEAKENEEFEKVTALICGSLKLLKAAKQKTDVTLTNGLLYLAKRFPSIFTRDSVSHALCSVLRRESSAMYKAKTTHTNAVLLTNVLYYGYQDVDRWPEIFLKLYIEDSLAERLWVDSEHCKCFVENLICSVNTKTSPRFDFDSGTQTDVDIDDREPPDYLVAPRFKGIEESIENIVIETVKDQINRRQATEGISKHFLKFLSCMCGITEVRAIVASKLEVWLPNPKLKNCAKELLMAVCINCSSNTQRDVDVIASIVKIRFKWKDLSGFYLACIRELISAHITNLSTLLRQTVANELFAVRNPNYIPMYPTLYQADPDQFASILAEIFLEYLMNREDYLRPLRSLLREVSKILRADLDLQSFARGLMGQTEPLPKDFEFRDRVFSGIADLVTQCSFLAVSLHVRSDRKDISQIERMQSIVANIQSDVACWFHETAYRVYKPSTNDFVHALHKVVFMEPADQYYKVDSWPPEQDRALFIRSATEVPLLQRTVLYILAIGLSKEHPLSCADALELVEQLVKRVSALTFSLTTPVLLADQPKLIDLLFNLSAYRHPENIELPANYVPPNLAIINLYWKSWVVLLIYCAHVPSIFGTLAWEKYPTLRVFIEMCITNHFVFPQTSDDLQLLSAEKQTILEFETYLAAASTKMTVTESTSLLLSQLITMDPTGGPRRPPSVVLDQLQQLNTTHKIGHLLCRSRNPDFLLDIIRKQGSSQSMPWLADLVQNSESSFNHLPVQCLCEFLLSSNEKQQSRYQQLLAHLRNQLTDSQRSPNVVCEILDHFLRRFSSHSNKEQAISGLKLLLSSSNEEEMEIDRIPSHGEQSLWILNKLPSIPHFQEARPQIVRALREACQVENDPELITSYLTFLAKHVAAPKADIREMTELVFYMAQLIVERSTIMTAILPSACDGDSSNNIALEALLKIFYTYLNKAREPRVDDGDNLWIESQDQILVSWPSGERATLSLLVVHAIIILLTYGSQCTDRAYLYYDSLLNLWFPAQRELAPKAYLVDTEEEALLIPDWLKLRMIRSNVTRLVEEALIDLEPSQLLLFIQSFGIPVESMSKLLETLDVAITTNRVSITEIAIDKTYMIQLVEVQRKRGASGGNIFANAIKNLDPDVPLQESPVSVKITKQEPEEDMILPSVKILDDEIDHIIESLSHTSKANRDIKFINDNKQKLLRSLSSELVNSSKSVLYPTRTLKKIINKLLRKCSTDPSYVNELVKNFHFASNLFRLLTTSTNKDNVAPLAVIAKAILESTAAKERPKNPLVITLQMFLNKNNYSEITANLSKDMETKLTMNALEDCSVDQLERTGNKLMESAMRKAYEAKTIVESVASLITRTDKKYKNGTGLFIDWLVQIEPEIIGSSLELQLDMLFSLKSDTKWESLQICRPYLLTLLTHHASWFTLETALTKLLTLESTKKYDATAVLEFLWALARNPRLWQGREKLTPKHQEPVDVLGLNEEQLICVIEYVVLEVENVGCQENSLSKMSHRISQLVECAIKPKNSSILLSVIHHLNEESSVSDLRREICQNVITQLYFRIPRINALLHEIQVTIDLDKTFRTDRESSALDVMSHSVLTSFTSNVQIKESPKRTQELELILRKMASTHPRLILRQIKIIETSLMGRVHLEWPVFNSRNNPSFFSQVFGVLELLQPHLFAVEFGVSLESIFECYLNLFRNHGMMNDIRALTNKFVTLSQNFISNDTKRAVSFFQSRSSSVRELAVDHACFGSLCILTAGAVNSSDEKEILIPAAVPTDTETHWDKIINSFKRGDPGQALNDLDRESIRNPALLEPMLERLFPILHDASSHNRAVTNMLLSRCLKNNPKTASRIVPAVFSCLHSNQPDVVQSACDRIPELIVCCQENALPILNKLFTLAIRNGINTSPFISKSLSLLNIQSSC